MDAETQVDKAGATKKARFARFGWVLLGLAGAVILLAAWLQLIAPYWAARRALQSVAVDVGYGRRAYVYYVGEAGSEIANAIETADTSALHQEALRRLFGSRQDALSSLRVYTSAPDFLAPRRADAYLMMQFCGPDAIQPLREALKEKDADVQHAAVCALGEMGGEAKDALPDLRAMSADRTRSGGIMGELLAWAVAAIESGPKDQHGKLHLRDMHVAVQNTGTKPITAVSLNVGDTTIECAKLDAGDHEVEMLEGKAAEEASLRFSLADGRKVERKIHWLQGLPKKVIKDRCIMFKLNGDSGEVEVKLR